MGYFEASKKGGKHTSVEMLAMAVQISVEGCSMQYCQMPDTSILDPSDVKCYEEQRDTNIGLLPATQMEQYPQEDNSNKEFRTSKLLYSFEQANVERGKQANCFTLATTQNLPELLHETHPRM